MFDIMKTTDMWDDMFRAMDALMQYPNSGKTLETQGLKNLIRRPHNIINVTDADGNVVAQRLEVVTTPFAKKDVKVTVENDTLTIQCGAENKEERSEDKYVYKGISSQSYVFSLKLGTKIDQTAIKAENADGVLKVTLPFKKETETKPPVLTIEVE